MATAAARAARADFLPYCLPSIGPEEIQEVLDTLRSGWLTTGPKVKRFEADFAAYTGARHAIAVSSCTAALHTALSALGVGPGDEVIVPTMTFCATANVVVHLGATPVLVDVDLDGLISPEAVNRAVTGRTKAIVPVHYGGQACDLEQIHSIAREHGIAVVEDAAHAVGTEFNGRRIGTHSNAVAFSFYATKNMTTGEGGMITTDDDHLAGQMRVLSLHGMEKDAWKRYGANGTWHYEVRAAGYKYNMTDLQAALGIHQLRKLEGFIQRRRGMAAWYAESFADLPELILPNELPGRGHVYHLYPIRIRDDRLAVDRAGFIEKLREEGIGASVHFIPLHRHPFYERAYDCRPEQFPVCEEFYRGLLSLPLYPGMSDADVDHVAAAVRGIVEANRL